MPGRSGSTAVAVALEGISAHGRRAQLGGLASEPLHRRVGPPPAEGLHRYARAAARRRLHARSACSGLGSVEPTVLIMIVGATDSPLSRRGEDPVACVRGFAPLRATEVEDDGRVR